MRVDSPRWEQLNPSTFAHELDGLRQLAACLPDTDPFHVWANVEFVASDGSINEIDALVLTPSGLYVLELKHWQGEIAGDGSQWMHRQPGGRLIPEDNPYILANRKAKRLAGLIRHYARQTGRERTAPYVGAAVFLHATAMTCRLDELGRQHVYGPDRHPGGLPSVRDLVLARPRNLDHLVDAARGRQIVELVRGAKLRPSVAQRKVGQLLLLPRPLAEGVGWQDFLAGHPAQQDLFRRVRCYLTSRAADDEVPAIRRAAEREFRLLQGIHHPGIAQAHDLVDHAWGPAVVFTHQRDWLRLDQWLAQRGERLTLAQRLHLVQDLAEIIDYAHSRRLAHRALHPRAIFVADPDTARPRLVVTDWQTAGRLAATTQLTRLGSTDGAGLELFFDDEMRRYQAPEAAHRIDLPGIQLDVFGLGAVAYRIFTGTPPAGSAEELAAAVRDSGLNLAGVGDGLPQSLVELIYDATRGDPAHRTATVSAFRSKLEAVWEDLTAPEPEPVVEPLTAQRGDVLEGGLRVLRRLGSGATATALKVAQSTPDGERELVLKVARDDQHAERFAAEAATLRRLQHWQVAGLVQETTVAGHPALLLENAGDTTLAQELLGGRLALEMLSRYGRDLLDIVGYLDGQGVWHRDLKPANLAARPRPKDSQLHLCVFDFSLAATPADQITAGTTGYLDPFLGPPRRMRYDGAAERFAAAVTLYEMATGSLPRWGDNANPAAISDEVTLDLADFDPADPVIATRLLAFFAKALARDAATRFDTAEEMADAWRATFATLTPNTPTPAAATPTPVAVPAVPPIPAPAGHPTHPIPATNPAPAPPPVLTHDSPLAGTGLTARALSALDRLGVHTVGGLLDYQPSALTRARGVPDATRREILAHAKVLRSQVPTPPEPPQPGGADPAAEANLAAGIEAVCATLLPPPATPRPRARAGRDHDTSREHDTLAVLLGQAPTPDGTFLRWPAQSEAARATGIGQPQISTWLRRTIPGWLDNPALSRVRAELVALLDHRGGVASAAELAEALISARGSYQPEPRRSTQAIGLVRAAVEAELATGGDARLAIQRFRTGDTVLVGREPDDPTAETTAADLLSYAVRLGRRAATLAGADPLPTRQRALAELRTVEAPDPAPVLDDQRLLRLAAIASNGEADLNPQGQLYPVGMAAERAVRLAAGGLTAGKLTADDVRDWVRARFPAAQPLPERPELDDWLAANGIPLTWDPTSGRYTSRTVGTMISTRMPTQYGPLADRGTQSEVDTRLTRTVDRRGFLALLTPMRHAAAARRALLARPIGTANTRLVEVNVTAILLETLHQLGLPWDVVLAADTGTPNDPDFRGLADLVTHHVMPKLTDALATDRPVLLTEAGPLTRYHQLGLIATMADISRPLPAARLLLVAARRFEPATLDDAQLPLPSPTSQLLWLPEAWVTTDPLTATTRQEATTR